MPLVIDCYNVLHTTMPPALAGLDEAGLCRAVAKTPWVHGGVTIVADGRPKPLGVTESPVDGIELVYAGQARTADDVIIAMIDADSAPRRLTVVSSDREIRAAARRRRAKVLTSDQFIDKLVRAVTRRRPPTASGGAPKPDPGPLPPESVERWLTEFGLEDETDAPSSSKPRRSDPSADEGDDNLQGIWPPW